ncbi:MAG TPA: DUF4097 family beta strand repeat-containing protein [Candidatus Angelobacter sp.]|nr:DUF4097 family beta strand repeat-containing protein [Candidatus Angelobacter sp.]
MKHYMRLGCGFLVFALLSSAAVFAQQDTKNFHWNGKLATDQTVTVKTINGEIQADPASADEVEVTAQATGTYAQEVNFQVHQDSNGVTICETYPGHDSCSGHNVGHHHDDHTRISYQVRVPAANRFAGHSVNGNVTANNLDRQVKASTVNGNVKVSTKSWAEAESVNGTVDATMGNANWPGTLRLASVNGAIHVGLPANANTDVDVRTVNGSFHSDFPVTSNSFLSHHVEGRVGSGGRELDLRTVNGSVSLEKTTM